MSGWILRDGGCATSLILWLLGSPARASDTVRQTLELAQELKHPASHAIALGFGGLIHQLCGRLDEATHCSRQLVEISLMEGFGPGIAWGLWDVGSRCPWETDLGPRAESPLR